MSFGFQKPPFGYIFWCQNLQKCLQGKFFEDFNGPREGFLKVFSKFPGAADSFLRFFEGFLAASEKVAKRDF